MGWYEDKALPWLIDKVLDNADTHRRRAAVCAGLEGTVLEIGFGSGLNMAHYPAEVERVLAVDPAVYGQELAGGRISASGVPVSFIGLDGATLPVEDESVDAVLSTFTLCTIPDVEAASREAFRVLKPGGSMHFLEHGHAEDLGVQQTQARVEPVWKRVFGGCHITRHPGELLQAAGFTVDLERVTEKPALAASLYFGTATKATVSP